MPPPDAHSPRRHDTVVVGASAGGIDALSSLLRDLPDDLAAAVLIVLHIATDAGGLLPRLLANGSRLPVRAAEDGAPLVMGEVRVAKANCHLIVEPGVMRVVRGPRENRFRPAIDPLFRSAAWAYGPRVIGVLLSGMLDDGTAGLWAIKTCGGIAVVQDPDDAAYGAMPRHAIDALPVDHCVPAARMGALVAALVREPAASEVVRGPDSLRLETSMMRQLQPDEIPTMDRIGKLSPYTCPSCHGSLWEIFDEHVLRFRCHTGHAFSAPSLGDEIDVGVEDALFGALRALEENARLSRTIAERSRTGKREAVAAIYDDKASECERNADVIRNLLHRSQMARADAG